MGIVSSFRQWAQQNSAMAGGIAVALLAVGLVLIITQGGSGLPAGDQPAYYYDLETGELFVGAGNQYPPIQSPAGNEAVRAKVFSCGTCSEEERFVGYYEKYTSEAKKVLEKAQAEQESGNAEEDDPGALGGGMGTLQAEMSGLEVSTDGENWQTKQAASMDGKGLMEHVKSQCDDPSQLKFCGPG